MGSTPKPRAEYSAPYSAEEDQKLIQLYEARATYSAIAKVLGRHASSVEYRLARLFRDGKLSKRVHKKPNAPKDYLVTEADRAWMAYWQQPRAVRRHLRHQRSAEQTND